MNRTSPVAPLVGLAGESVVREPRPRPAPVPSEALLRGQRLLEIAHNGEVYRLQATRLGKLILTK